MPEGRREQRVPGDLAVEVSVDVDKARRDEQAVGVDFFAAEVVDFADGGDDAVVNGDIGLAGRRTGAVDDPVRCGSRDRACSVLRVSVRAFAHGVSRHAHRVCRNTHSMPDSDVTSRSLTLMDQRFAGDG